MKRLLMRADDLGYSDGVNYGILKAASSGLIRSIGVMTNMPYARQGILNLKGLPICFGQHTNICVGRPLCDPKMIPSLCNENGEFKKSKTYREAKAENKDFVVVEEAVLEIEAQYQQFLSLVGSEPGYFEAHAVASDNFYKALEIVADRHGLSYLPMSFDGSPVYFRNTRIYSYMPKDFKAYENNPIDAVKDAVANAHDDGCDMMVFHPGYIDAYLYRTSSMTIPRIIEAEMLCDPNTKEWLQKQDIELVTFDDLK